MKASENLATLLLGIWLILSGLMSLLGWHSPLVVRGLFILAIVAGLLLLVGKVTFKSSLGAVCLGIWLILTALLPYLPTSFPYLPLLLHLLGLASGVLIILGR